MSRQTSYLSYLEPLTLLNNRLINLIYFQICESRGKPISKDLAALTIKYVYQNPRYGFDANEALDVEEVQRLVSICKDRLLHDHGPVMETLRMQVGHAHTTQPDRTFSRLKKIEMFPSS